MPAQPVWATPRNVALLIAAYLLVHLGVRIWIGPALGFDDAEQALFAQHWLPSYRLRAPPLFTWALVAVGEVAGIGMPAISLLRYLLLAALFGFVYLTARRLIRDPGLAALATFSFAAIYVFGYYSHHDLTHTTVLSAFLAASWYAFVRLCETPRLRWYLALGLCFGLGILGKWNFVMFALALPLACLLHPRWRGLVLDWRIVPAALVTAAVALPSALWAFGMGPSSGDAMDGLLGQGSGGALPLVLAKGTASLAVALLAYPLPFLVIFLAVFGGAAWRGLRAPPASAPGPALEPVPDSALIGTVMVVAVALHWLLVPLARATEFQERLLQPALLILPVYLFMAVERGLGRSGPAARAVNGYALALAAVAGVALAARIAIPAAGADTCRSACRDLMPVEALAAGLRGAGFTGSGTVVVRDIHLGGNLRVQFPAARVMATGYPPRVWPRPVGTGQCLLVWSAYTGPAEEARAQVQRYAAGDLAVPADAKPREGTVEVPYARSRRTYRIHYALYDTPQGECR
jgi:4-amino-4-deoxy-L-arabinose transferase-like glycosyltransferase